MLLQRNNYHLWGNCCTLQMELTGNHTPECKLPWTTLGTHHHPLRFFPNMRPTISKGKIVCLWTEWHIPRTWLVRGQNSYTRNRFNRLHEENSGTQKALLVMLAYTSKQNSFHSRTHRVTTFGVPYGMNMPHVFLHVSNYGRFHATKKNRLEISEIPRAQWNVHSGWTDPTQATGTLDMVIVIVRRIQKSSTGDNNFVNSVRPIEITRPVKVDHFRSWSRILRSDQNKMIRSIWCTNRNFRNFGLNGMHPIVYIVQEHTFPRDISRPSLEPEVRKLLHIETLCKGQLFTWRGGPQVGGVTRLSMQSHFTLITFTW